MLHIVVELLHGTMRAATADDLALTGGMAEGEWPPSPARLFAALVAGDGTGSRTRCTDGGELVALERAAPPVIHADTATHMQPLRLRYVASDDRAAGITQNYPARAGVAVRPGVRVSPRTPTIVYEWPDLDLDAEAVAALRRRAERVGYLGCSDSPARVRVVTDAVPSDVPRWVPDPDGDVLLPVPFEGFVDILDAMFEEFSNGRPVRRSWYPKRLQRYRSPQPSQPVPPPAAWLRFERPITGRQVLAVTETLRAAVLDRYTPVLGDGAEHDERGVPAVLSGHGFEGKGYETASYLALPDVGAPFSRGRIHGAAVVLPRTAPPELVHGVRVAVASLRELVLPGVFATAVAPFDPAEQRPRAANPRRWSRPAHRFASAFPVVHERHRRGGPALDDVAAWCEHAGVPATPVAFRSSRVPMIPGGVSLHPSLVYREGRPRLPYSHVEVAFDQPVAGPFALGQMRQFGFGLMVPLADERGDART